MKTCWKCGWNIRNGEAIAIRPKLSLNDHGMIKSCENRYFHKNCYYLMSRIEREQT